MATDDKEKNVDYSLAALGFSDDEMLQARIAEIANLTGEEKRQAIQDLSLDYEGLTEAALTDLVDARSDYNAETPEGREAGGIYVAANPLEHISAALRRGFGGWEKKQARDKLAELSAGKQRATGKVLEAAARQSADQAQPQPQPQPQSQPQPLDSLTSQNPGLNQGLSDITQQAMQPEAQVGRAMERRGELRQQGITPPPVGTGVAGQAKQAAALRGNHNAPVAGLAGAEAAMGQQPASPEVQHPYSSGKSPAPYNPRGNAISKGMTERMNPNWNEEDERKRMLFGLMNRHSGGY